MSALGKIATYEYAGFLYDIVPEGHAHLAIPAPGQHQAARKDKHCRAALERWREENPSAMRQGVK